VHGYDPSTWGDRLADVYEEWLAATPVDSEREQTISLLADLAGEGRVLELAVGSGRLAIPLAERGLDVYGIDASGSMIAKLRERPGGDRVTVSVGNFADVAVEGEFSLIFVVFNTFPALVAQEEQVRCFRNAAEHLTRDGLFVVETATLNRSWLARDNSIYVWGVEPDRVMLSFERHDAATQTTIQMEAWITEQETRFFPSLDRYVWIGELDLMARLAGLELRERYGGWGREPFTAESRRHISAYGRASGA
jgi:SAM-dependent methyltransferase